MKTFEEALEPTEEIRLKYYEQLTELFTKAHNEMGSIPDSVDRDAAFAWLAGHSSRLSGCMVSSGLNAPIAAVDIKYLIDSTAQGYEQGLAMRAAPKRTFH